MDGDDKNIEPISIDLDAMEAAARAASDASAEALKRAAEAKPAEAVEAAGDEVQVVTDETPPEQEATGAVSVDEGLEKLRAELAAEKARRQEAEAQAQAAAAAEVQARTEVQENQLAMVTNAIAAIKQANDALKARYREARAAGDADVEFEIQAEMSANAAKLVQLEQGKQRLEAAPKPQIREPRDPVAAFTSRLSEPSANWVRAHPDYVRDPLKNRQMIAAHELALARGIQVDTPEYFSAIEKTLDITVPAPTRTQGDDPMKEAAKAAAPVVPPKKSAPAAAPVSRSGNGAGERTNVVHLSADEREIARLNKMTDAEYAKAKVALKREKRLN